MKPSLIVSTLLGIILLSSCNAPASTRDTTNVSTGTQTGTAAPLLMPDFTKISYDVPAELIDRSNGDWKKVLPPQSYTILREAGTERPYSSELADSEEEGIYVTADCGEPVFSSEQKFHSGTGWPSFWAPLNPDAIELRPDPDGERIEIVSKKCKSHLGHVFDDGPPPTGKRFCINGAGLRFIPKKKL